MNKLEILLIDDNYGDIVLLKEVGEESDLISSFHYALDGESAMEIMIEETNNRFIPNLILLDINLPKMNGFELLKLIKSTQELKHIPVVVLTTSSSPTDIREAYQNHASAYITKASDIEGMYTLLHHLENFWCRTVQIP